MRRFLALIAFVATTASAQKPFTLQQILSAPYSTNLTAAPVGSLFAWVEDAEGRHNLWIGGAAQPARQLTHYTEDDAQDIASLAWSPDGKTIAYVYGAETGASGRPANPAHLQRPTPVEIILQPVDGGAATVLGEGHAPLFTPDGKSLLYVRSGQIFITDLAALKICALNKICHPEQAQRAEGPATRLAPGTESGPFTHQLLFDRGSASSLTLSPDGKLLGYISHRRTHSFLALYNLEAKTLTFPAPSTGDDSAPIFSRDGKQLAWLRFPFTDAPEFAGNRTSPNPWSIQILNVATKETRTLFQPEANQPGSAEPRMSTGEPHLYWTAPLDFSPNLSPRPNAPRHVAGADRPAASSGSVVFFSEADGWVHLYRIDPTSPDGKPSLLTPGDFEVEDATISPDGETFLYAGNPAEHFSFSGPSSSVPKFKRSERLAIDRRHLFLIDLTHTDHFGGVYTHSKTYGDGIETHPQIAADGTIAALASTTAVPMHPVVLSAPQQLHDLRPDWLPTIYPSADLVTPQQLIFPSSDKLFQLHGQLFMPKAPATTKHPAILFFHGGPKRQMLLGYPAMDYYSNAYAMNQYLASRGYIVLSVNYRGGIGYGLDFRQCQHCGADGAAEYDDVLGAVAYLRSRPDVDIAHIGIWGGSYGGYLTALALARNSDLFAAGVDFHGVHEWAREDNARSDWLRGPLAVQEGIAARAHASSPMADIDKWRSPVLLIHGDDDPEVAYTQTPMLADALRARGVHVEELIFPDELHGFLLHRDWLAAYEAAANFFDRTLKPSK
ncbi:MAG TPA: prolyl oligopeptidase family serine peptidase [Acidobacteriaceae bacterium]